ncbi:MAG TPA: response regulator transcription factor [Planctomycetota bacterium]|nr:response regulator transcription factor [Planctomycetota bacterium]
MTFQILLVEDDRAIRTVLRDALQNDGHDVTTAADGDEALAVLRARTFDLLVLDVLLPGPSGLEILQVVRKKDQRTPVLLLTARSSEGDKVLGLELGADDYVTKPFSLRELRTRVRVLLRRVDRSPAQPAGRFRLGPLDVDLDAYEVRRGRAVQRLSPTETAMLALLWQERGRVVDRARFLREVWGGSSISNRTVDTHLLHLRQKLEVDPKEPVHLLTVHGVGYRLAVADEDRP